ncbi:MAG: PQQ-binding-like beta-propeller repeat protein [Planctomycetota bacterium]|nr:PQQ-binding-like beta-propeller repeat protein [Planctomycetota bacterium]
MPKVKKHVSGILWTATVFAVGALTANSQVRIQLQEAPAQLKTERVDEKQVKKNEEKYAGGAALKTDSDLEDSLKRASAFVEEKNYRNAAILWDRVLEKSGNSLITEDGETYISLVRQVEETIRNLPANGLQVYRISADGKAKALVPGQFFEATDDALSKLVRLYFMSSFGDDAAYELGCRSLDRHDFVAASRMFNKILTEHPDPSVNKNEVLIRVAIAAGNLGDQEAADQAINSTVVDDDSSAKVLLANVKQHLVYLSKSKGGIAEGGESVAMRLVGSDRSGVMPDLPENATDGDLTQGYEFRFPYMFSKGKGGSDLGEILQGGSVDQEKADTGVTALSQKWKSEKWFPAGQLLYSNSRVVFKTTNDLVCIDATGKSELAIWHSLWLNHFDLDDASWNARTYGQTARNRNGSPIPVSFPKDEKEGWYFFDKIHQSMSIHQGVVYSIEGKNYSQLDDSIPRTRKSSSTNRVFNQPVNLTRSRTNYLTAYNLQTGKVLWTRSALEKSATLEEEKSDTTQGKAGFLGTPIPFGNLVLCPVTEGGAISIYAMDSSSKGKTVWKTFLCDDPSEGVNHFSPVEITIAGQEAYVTCGSGVLFALNAATGNIQFARRYQRDGKKQSVQTSYNQRQEMLMSAGWDDDVVVAWRNALIVMASDHDYVFAIDRRNGRFLWDAPRIPFDEEVSHAYCLGHCNDMLFMATNKAILAYSLSGDGKLQWYHKFAGNSYGRGFITSQGVYVPVEDTIVKYDLKTGRQLSQVGVNLGVENKVGNLFSDGHQIWIVGLNRVVALRSLRDRLEELGAKISEGDLRAIQERLKIFAKLEEYDKAFEDVQKLYELQVADKTSALKQLLVNLEETGIFSKLPAKTIQFLDKVLVAESPNASVKDLLTNRYQVFFDTATAAVAVQGPAVTHLVLGWSRLGLPDGFNSAIVKFLTTYPPDVASMAQVLESADEKQLLLLIPVVTKVDSANSLLVDLLSNDSESVQISSASELAIRGDKSCLAVAQKILGSTSEFRRVEAYLILKNMTGAKIEFKANGTEEERKKSAGQWKVWLDENADSLKVKMPVQLRFGKILVGTTQKIMEFSIGKGLTKEDGEITGYNPEDVVALRNGNKIVVEYSRRRILELDFSGKQINAVATTKFPRSARKLRNGNYLVAWTDTTRPVVELDSKGRVVWEAKNVTGSAFSAERLASGNTLIAFNKRVVEIDGNSNIVYQISSAQGVSNCKEARRLANGNTLVVHSTIVSIFDKDKNQVLRIRGSFTPKSAIQLKDGKLLVAHATGLRVFDKEGTKIGDDFVNENVNSVWEY